LRNEYIKDPANNGGIKNGERDRRKKFNDPPNEQGKNDDIMTIHAMAAIRGTRARRLYKIGV